MNLRWPSFKFLWLRSICPLMRSRGQQVQKSLNDIFSISTYPFLAHLAQSAKVSYCDRSMSVVRRRVSWVVCRGSCVVNISLNNFSSITNRPFVMKLCRNDPWVTLFYIPATEVNMSINEVKRSISAKIFKRLLLHNHWAIFDETLQEWPSGDLLLNSCYWGQYVYKWGQEVNKCKNL